MIYTYEKDFNTSYSTIDLTGKLGLTELMAINQDMCTEFFGSIKSDNKILKDKDNAIWLYTRTKVKTGTLPLWNTKTHARTFVSALSPIRVEIETDLTDENKNLVFAAKTELCAIDFSERRIRKIETLTFPKDVEKSDSSITEPYAKLRTEFSEEDFVYETKVFASDTDFSCHTNNARYVKFLMNSFDSAFYNSKKIETFDIQFAKESVENDILRIYRKQLNDSEIAFQIRKGDEVVVKAEMQVSN